MISQAISVEVKEEKDEDAEEGADNIITVPIQMVWNLQTSCSSRFRDGRTLEETTFQLQRGIVDELEHRDFVLNVAKGRVDGRTYYWTLDHRRLVCLKQAGKQLVRVKVCLSGKVFDEFVRKAFERLQHGDAIRVRQRYR